MHPSRSPVRLPLWPVVIALAALFAACLAAVSPALAADALLSEGRTATASSTQGAGYGAGAAFDGSRDTRWSSAAADPQWLQVDLGASATISRVVLDWENAYAKA
ncbi:discoidin domain-containing protein, partial [Nonomuraea sp. NPDC004297]